MDRRKLAAIFAADVAGYSRLMADDEVATLRSLNEVRDIFRKRVESRGGRLIDTAGDSILAEFPSAVEAANCAGEIQHELGRRNAQFAEHRRMHLRIGINLGDIIEQEDGTIYGDGVNVAARLQQLAEPGGICISGTAFDQVDGKLHVQFKFIGEQQVKNISKPVRAYKVLTQASTTSVPVSAKKRRRWALWSVFLIFISVAIGDLAWSWRERIPHTFTGTAAARFLSEKPTLAVLPFTNMSNDPKQDYLSDGITEDIITALSRFTKLSVVARNSTFSYKGKSIDVRQVGKDLGVRYVLEGSVQRSPGRARITAQLIDARDGKHVWAENYDRELKDLLSVQDEVTQQIVGRLDVELDRAQLEQARRTSPKDFTAYDLVLRARKLIYDHSEVNHRESRDLLERAVALDAELAQAYIELAWIYLDEYRFNWNARPDPLQRALKAATRAVELEPNNGFAHWRLAKILFFRNELEQFEIEMRRALVLNPNHAETLADVAVHLGNLDRIEEAFKYAQKAIKLDPQLTWAYFPISGYYYRKQHYREALTAAYQINIPEFYWTRVFRAISYAQLGELESSRKEAAEVRRLKPDFVYRDEVKIWNNPEGYATHLAEGARKAGIPVNRGDTWK